MTAEGRKEHCVTIARNNLRRGGLDGEPEFCRDMGFDARVDIRVSADGARISRRSRFPSAHAPAARGRAQIQHRPARASAPKVMGSAWMPCERPIIGRKFVLERAALQRGEQMRRCRP